MRDQNIIFFPPNKYQKPFVYNPRNGNIIDKKKQNKIEKIPKKNILLF